MTLLDRFRTQTGQHHPDPSVRLQYVAAIPLDERDLIAAVAREDQDAQVRRAAVAKLLDPSVLGAIVESDADESVRERATAMLQDIALEVFEGVSESDGLEAVDALRDSKRLGLVAKTAAREIVALRALSRITDPKTLGTVARHGVSEAARQSAFAILRERNEQAEILGVAMNGEHKDTAVGAVDLVTERVALEAIAERSRNKSAVKRARTLMREADEGAERAAADVAAARQAEGASRASEETAAQVLSVPVPESEVPSAPSSLSPPNPDAEAAARQPEKQESGEQRPDDRRAQRFFELCGAAEAAAGLSDLGLAHRRLAEASREWRHLAEGHTVEAVLQERFEHATSKILELETLAREAGERARHEALTRLQHLVGRSESLVQKSEIALKAGERTVRDIRRALEAVPPLPSKDEFEEITRRLKAARDVLVPRVLELREAAEWQRFANAAIQEQLCLKMVALAEIMDDPDQIAHAVRDLQQQWRAAADVPRGQADALWRRFKDAHDVVWTKAEALFAAQAETRAANLDKKLAMCLKAEALADSTNWISTAEELKRLQAEWKTVGPVTRGAEKSTWDRFRAACDHFFKRRHDDLAARKKTWAENLKKKEALCERAESLAESTDWDQAASELKRLQAEWKTVGPVRKSRSDAIWQRFRAACDRFFQRHAARHDTARAERVAAREAICAELEGLVSSEHVDDAPADLLERVRAIRTRWHQEIVTRGVDPDSARRLDARFISAFAAPLVRWPVVFAGTELDPDASRRRMETLVKRVEDLAQSLAGPAAKGTADESELSPTDRLAAMLKEALATNTIGGRGEDDGRLRLAAEAVHQARDAWSRVGLIPPVADAVRRELTDRFERACQRIGERVGGQSVPASKAGRSGRPRRPGGPSSPGRSPVEPTRIE
jgi:hypothetical protein